MQQTEQFKLRISPQEKAMLTYVAKHFQRSQSDTLRTLVREVYAIVKTKKAQEAKVNSQ
jgi:hypothetical protein